MPRMGEGRKALQVRTRGEVHSEQQPLMPTDPPVPEVETPPTQSELEKRIEEAEKLGEVGRLPGSSSTQQLAQMAVEAKPSLLDGEEPA